MNPLLVSRGNKPRKGTVAVCLCGRDFYRNPSRSHVKYCSVPCKNKFSIHARVYAKCKHCGKDFFRYQSQIKHRGNATACSNKCLIECRKGENSPNWIKDRSKIKERPNGNADHREWRKKVFERDNYTCQFCAIRGMYLEADHIKPWAFYPTLRFELSNGRTLCKQCHNKTKFGPLKMKRLFQEGYWDKEAILETQKKYNLRQKLSEGG